MKSQKFIDYRNGNIVCKLLNPHRTFNKTDKGLIPSEISVETSSRIEVPIIYTKFVCNPI